MYKIHMFVFSQVVSLSLVSGLVNIYNNKNRHCITMFNVTVASKRTWVLCHLIQGHDL